MSQVNVNPPGDYRDRDSGVGTILAVVLVLALIAFLVWAVAFGGFNTFAGAPTGSTTAPASDTNVNVQPKINVEQPSGNTAPAGGNTAPSGGTTGGNTAPSKP